jgi:hypothetical protein
MRGCGLALSVKAADLQQVRRINFGMAHARLIVAIQPVNQQQGQEIIKSVGNWYSSC